MNENIEKYLKVIAEKTAQDIIGNRSKEMMEQFSKDKELVALISQYILKEQEYFKDKVFYSEKHTWVNITTEWTGRIGLTDYAISYLKNLAKIYTEKIGSMIRILEPFGVAETWMVMFDLYSPIAGKIVAVNKEALENVEKLDSKTWLIEVRPLSHAALMKELELLMDEKEYASYIAKTSK